MLVVFSSTPVAVAGLVATGAAHAALGTDRRGHRLGVAEVPARGVVLLDAAIVVASAPVAVLHGAAGAVIRAHGASVGRVPIEPAVDEPMVGTRQVVVALGRIVVIQGFRRRRTADDEEGEEGEEDSRLHVILPVQVGPTT